MSKDVLSFVPKTVLQYTVLEHNIDIMNISRHYEITYVR